MFYVGYCLFSSYAIPINITYNIDIYTQRYDEGDEYLRAMVFNIVNQPKMKVVIPIFILIIKVKE